MYLSSYGQILGASSAEVNLPRQPVSIVSANPVMMVMASSALHVQVQSMFSFEALVALLALEDLVLAGWFVWILVRAFL